MLNDTERQILDGIRNCRSAQQAERLLHDLLEFTRLGKRPHWTPFQRATSCLQDGREIKPTDYLIFVNSRYQVTLFHCEDDERFGPVIHLSIKSRENSATAHDWRDMQRIKNELLGPEVEAVEVFPAESRLVDTSNQYHLFCFPGEIGGFPGLANRRVKLPWTISHTRLVSESVTGSSCQRPFDADCRPGDLVDITPEMLAHAKAEYLKHQEQCRGQADMEEHV